MRARLGKGTPVMADRQCQRTREGSCTDTHRLTQKKKNHPLLFHSRVSGRKRCYYGYRTLALRKLWWTAPPCAPATTSDQTSSSILRANSACAIAACTDCPGARDHPNLNPTQSRPIPVVYPNPPSPPQSRTRAFKFERRGSWTPGPFLCPFPSSLMLALVSASGLRVGFKLTGSCCCSYDLSDPRAWYSIGSPLI